MGEIERTRVREREPSSVRTYDRIFNYLAGLREQSLTAKIVIKGEGA